MSEAAPTTTSTDQTVARTLMSVLQNRLELAEVLDHTLAELGVESWAFTAFLARLEEEFDMEWDFDVPAETFDSVRTIADHLDRVTS
jgi:acyl carrier protein